MKMNFFILALLILALLGCFDDAEAQTQITRYVTTGCANNGDGTSATCAASGGAAGAYNSCANAESDTRPTVDIQTDDIQVTIHFRQNTTTPTPDAHCEFRIENWGDGDATRFLHLINDQDHGGAWNTSVYHMSAARFFMVLDLGPAFSRVEGMQVEQTRATDDGRTHVIVSDGRNQFYRNNIVESTNTTEVFSNHGFGIGDNDRDNHGVTMINNIAIGGNKGFVLRPTINAAFGGMLANNTAYGQHGSSLENDTSLVSASGSSVFIYNNIMKPAAGGIGYDLPASVNPTVLTGGNFTTDATSPDGATNQNVTFSFVDEANFDLHLLASDTSGAFNNGVDLTADPNFAFSDDIDGDNRAGNCWDAGADEVDINSIVCGLTSASQAVIRRRRGYR